MLATTMRHLPYGHEGGEGNTDTDDTVIFWKPPAYVCAYIRTREILYKTSVCICMFIIKKHPPKNSFEECCFTHYPTCFVLDLLPKSLQNKTFQEDFGETTRWKTKKNVLSWGNQRVEIAKTTRWFLRCDTLCLSRGQEALLWYNIANR